MANCRLNVHLEEERESWRPGEVIRGTVEVRTDEEVACRGLQAGLRWRTRGKGTAVARLAVSEEVFEGSWPAGTVTSYPFTLQVPAGPFSYEGRHLSVVWEVVARADVAWKFDPKTEHGIVVAADPEAEPDWRAAAGDPLLWTEEPEADSSASARPVGAGKPRRRIRGLGCLLAILVPATVLFGYAVLRALAFARGEISSNEGLGWIVVGVCLAVFFGGSVVKIVRDLLAVKKLGAVSLEVDPLRVRAGEAVGVKLSFQPRQAVELVSATARLEAEEHVTWGSTERRAGKRTTLHEKEVELAVGRSLRAGMPLEIQGSVPIPEGAPPSFAATDNRVTWTLSVRLEVARWPDWVEERTLRVHP